MGRSQAQEANAVACGYWQLWRYNPLLAEEGKNPFSLDSKEPEWDKFQDFLHSEVRFLSVLKAYPNEGEELFKACEDMASYVTRATFARPRKTGAKRHNRLLHRLKLI